MCRVECIFHRVVWARQGKFICVAQFRHKATHSGLQEHTNDINIKNCIQKQEEIKKQT